ncbi:hypothetical protein AVEN_172327-1 [Araneus ventricosus]|uniref:Uncharacterized protein n=1 Tax=Araneus ventricosus TaxID=182803 RepID=A0A4Y2E3V9_ARAVE|nr:hypothetical protein AVEN_172327-1 [Araneus ventricosus]
MFVCSEFLAQNEFAESTSSLQLQSEKSLEFKISLTPPPNHFVIKYFRTFHPQCPPVESWESNYHTFPAVEAMEAHRRWRVLSDCRELIGDDDSIYIKIENFGLKDFCLNDDDMVLNKLHVNFCLYYNSRQLCFPATEICLLESNYYRTSQLCRINIPKRVQFWQPKKQYQKITCENVCQV